MNCKRIFVVGLLCVLTSALALAVAPCAAQDKPVTAEEVENAIRKASG